MSSLPKENAERTHTLAKIPDECPHPIVRIQADSTVMYSNHAAHKLMEFWDCQEGQKLPKEWSSLIETVLETNETRDFELECRDSVYELLFSPMPQANAVNIFAREITDVKTTERLLQEARSRNFFASKMAALGEMASGIAHEINNPLMIIHWQIDELKFASKKGKLTDEKLNKVCDKVISTTQRISKIIKGIRAFARDGSSDPFEPVKIKEVIEDALELCRIKLKNTGIPLELDENISDDLELQCRASQISQVIINNVHNAVDAVKDYDDKWVKIGVEDLEDEVQISITDSGTGISEELQMKIFQPFFTTKGVGKGTGLGLSISRGLIEAHKGRYEIDPDCENTRFIIRLPKIQEQAEAEAGAPPESEPQSA